MTQSLTPLDSLLLNIVLATLAIGLPILVVLSIRFLWDRKLNVGQSKQLEKLIWQLHRIASAMEHQMNLSFPAVQPGPLAIGAGIPYSAATSRVFHIAAKNPDGSMVLVLTNPGEAKEVSVACGGQTAKIALTADSITTLRWS